MIPLFLPHLRASVVPASSCRIAFAHRHSHAHSRACRLNFIIASVIALLMMPSIARAQAVGDFNNDGFADLAIGVPGQGINSGLRAGAVHVLYGSAARLTAIGAQFWHLDSPGIPGAAETGDGFGRALAVGDFNGDSFDDLAIGIPGREISGDEEAGQVLIIYGSALGLRSDDAAVWHQSSDGVENGPDVNDNFGMSLAAGNFNGDGFDDLAVGVPGEDGDDGLDAGAVAILYGSLDGITADGDQFFQQDSNGIDGTSEGNDGFGEALASGDFNNDGRDDLAIAVSGEDFDNRDDAGMVHVLFGTVGGLTGGGAQTWSQNTNGVPETAEDDDNFGAALATGDFDNDGFDDLAIGVAEESVGNIQEAGGVLVLRGSNLGLTTTGVKFFTQNQGNIRDQSEANDRFGNALAVGDFDNDGYDDLAIGVPNEKLNGQTNAGAINVIRGSANGLVGDANQFWHQNQEGIIDKCEPNDGFGSTLAAGDFDNDGRDDLAVGIPFENIGNVADAGAVAVLYGGGQALSKGPDQFWHQNVSGIEGSCGEDEYFGAANID